MTELFYFLLIVFVILLYKKPDRLQCSNVYVKAILVIATILIYNNYGLNEALVMGGITILLLNMEKEYFTVDGKNKNQKKNTALFSRKTIISQDRIMKENSEINTLNSTK